jgi:sugar phosphate isomerase/epimerase
MFGEGEMDFPPIIKAFRQANYRGGIHVELSRHSHEGPIAAQRAYDFLSPLVKSQLPE